MPEGGLLGPPADLIDHRVGQPDGMEVVHDHGRVAERDDQCAGIAAPGVQRDRGDAGQPVMGPSTEPAVDRGPGAVGHHVQQATLLQVDQAGHIAGGRQAGGLEEGGLVQAERGHTLQPRGVVHQRDAVVSHCPHDGRPADPEVAGDRGDRVGVLPTRRQASARARSVSTARGRIAAACSVQVRTPQAGSRQRQSRLRQASTTGRPPSGRSRTRTVRRPCGVARTPQPTQPIAVAVVWTASCHSPPTSSAETSWKPSRSSSLEAEALLC
jgi:hypothetical protein